MIERQRPQSKISIEDLIRLKRAEQPAPEFWTDFDNQLRRKQLAAIVEKRPWWRRLSASTIAKFSLPVGATAVIAFALAAARERAPSATVADSSVSSSLNAEPQAIAVSDASRAPSTDLIDSPEALGSRRDRPLEASSLSRTQTLAGNASVMEEPNGSLPSSTASAHAEEPSLAQVILGLGGVETGDARRYYDAEPATSLTPLAAAEPQLARDLPSSLGEPLTQSASYQDSRRARLLASVGSTERTESVAGNSRVARSRERIANRLAEQSLYDSISRLGLSGDSVSIKF